MGDSIAANAAAPNFVKPKSEILLNDASLKRSTLELITPAIEFKLVELKEMVTKHFPEGQQLSKGLQLIKDVHLIATEKDRKTLRAATTENYSPIYSNIPSRTLVASNKENIFTTSIKKKKNQSTPITIRCRPRGKVKEPLNKTDFEPQINMENTLPNIWDLNLLSEVITPVLSMAKSIDLDHLYLTAQKGPRVDDGNIIGGETFDPDVTMQLEPNSSGLISPPFLSSDKFFSHTKIYNVASSTSPNASLTDSDTTIVISNELLSVTTPRVSTDSMMQSFQIMLPETISSPEIIQPQYVPDLTVSNSSADEGTQADTTQLILSDACSRWFPETTYDLSTGSKMDEILDVNSQTYEPMKRGKRGRKSIVRNIRASLQGLVQTVQNENATMIVDFTSSKNSSARIDGLMTETNSFASQDINSTEFGLNPPLTTYKTITATSTRPLEYSIDAADAASTLILPRTYASVLTYSQVSFPTGPPNSSAFVKSSGAAPLRRTTRRASTLNRPDTDSNNSKSPTVCPCVISSVTSVSYLGEAREKRRRRKSCTGADLSKASEDRSPGSADLATFSPSMASNAVLESNSKISQRISSMQNNTHPDTTRCAEFLVICDNIQKSISCGEFDEIFHVASLYHSSATETDAVTAVLMSSAGINLSSTTSSGLLTALASVVSCFKLTPLEIVVNHCDQGEPSSSYPAESTQKMVHFSVLDGSGSAPSSDSVDKACLASLHTLERLRTLQVKISQLYDIVVASSVGPKLESCLCSLSSSRNLVKIRNLLGESRKLQIENTKQIFKTLHYELSLRLKAISTVNSLSPAPTSFLSSLRLRCSSILSSVIRLQLRSLLDPPLQSPTITPTLIGASSNGNTHGASSKVQLYDLLIVEPDEHTINKISLIRKSKSKTKTGPDEYAETEPQDLPVSVLFLRAIRQVLEFTSMYSTYKYHQNQPQPIRNETYKYIERDILCLGGLDMASVHSWILESACSTNLKVCIETALTVVGAEHARQFLHRLLSQKLVLAALADAPSELLSAGVTDTDRMSLQLTCEILNYQDISAVKPWQLMQLCSKLLLQEGCVDDMLFSIFHYDFDEFRNYFAAPFVGEEMLDKCYRIMDIVDLLEVAAESVGTLSVVTASTTATVKRQIASAQTKYAKSVRKIFETSGLGELFNPFDAQSHQKRIGVAKPPSAASNELIVSIFDPETVRELARLQKQMQLVFPLISVL